MSESDLKSMVEKLNALIDHWRFEAFHGSVVAREVGVWNFVHAATEDLKRRVNAAFQAETP